MTKLLAGLSAVLLFASQAAAAPSADTGKSAATSAAKPSPEDPVEKEYRRILEDDDKSQDEIDKWILEEGRLQAQGAGLSRATLALRIEQRRKKVEDAYLAFLQRRPGHTRARLAFGSFLNDQGRETEAAEQWQKAAELDPKNPAAWNNLANFHGHNGPVAKAFEYYQKAIDLAPFETTYYYNFAVTVYLFRKDAREHFQTDEDGVFDKSLALYRKALELDPNNFQLATDYAQSFYGIRPPRLTDGIEAWNAALKLARDDFEREGVQIHLARFEINAGRFDDARKRLNGVKDPRYKGLVDRVAASLQRKEQATRGVAESKAAAPDRE